MVQYDTAGVQLFISNALFHFRLDRFRTILGHFLQQQGVYTYLRNNSEHTGSVETTC